MDPEHSSCKAAIRTAGTPPKHTPDEPERRSVHMPDEPERRSVHMPDEPERRSVHTPDEPERRSVHTPDEPEHRSAHMPDGMDRRFDGISHAEASAGTGKARGANRNADMGPAAEAVKVRRRLDGMDPEHSSCKAAIRTDGIPPTRTFFEPDTESGPYMASKPC